MAKKVIEGAITSPFGVRKDPLDGCVRIHQGVDISAPVGIRNIIKNQLISITKK